MHLSHFNRNRKRTYTLAALILLVTVWLEACEKSDEQSRSGPDSGPLVDAGFSDAYSLAHGLETKLVDSDKPHGPPV